ncbi:alpha/beta fold hydrolase [Schinkia azotoformans]|uniref:alpha/beta fold hydrolase n=1 Tax=Schinkia azotoformans TaxID=1454 RepID=UPI002DB6F769|nr:alpha/beta fold hydrolase [Schinkia azotoformans]MEC1722680.1 alpha/beta fold hydrolase [Schinkia azotoformans]MED4413030.1 alpha/beta fold hydrolase [Schinkia azotoformans]
MNTQSIILLPGWGLENQVWSPLEEKLGKHYNLYFVEWHDINTITDFKQRAAHLIEIEKLSSFFLLGCSLGSIVALEIARSFPEQVKGIVMLGGTSRFTVEAATGYTNGWPSRIVERMKSNMRRDLRKTLISFYTSMFSKNEIENGELDQFLSLRINQSQENNLESLLIGLDYLNQMDLRNDLEKISSPMLLIHGEEDKVCPKTAVDYILQQMNGNAVLKTLPGTGHLPFLSKPEKCVEWIQMFIAENSLAKGEGRGTYDK